MATIQDAHKAIVEAIEARAKKAVSAEEVRNLAEAYAWLVHPDQAHGGHSKIG